MATPDIRGILDVEMCVRARLEANPGLIDQLKNWHDKLSEIWPDEAHRNAKKMRVEGIIRAANDLDRDLRYFLEHDLEPSRHEGGT